MDFWDQNLMDAEHCPEIKALYEGQITSTLQCRHCSSSCNVATERFHTLHLPIIGTTGKLFRTVSAALQAYESLPSVPSHVESWQCGNKECQARALHRDIPHHTRHVIHSPIVLMLHLMRWKGTAQLLHAVEACETLQLANGERYRLCSIICHEGAHASNGHYTNVCRYPTSGGEWWYYNNRQRRLATCAERTATSKERSYILFYEHTVSPHLPMQQASNGILPRQPNDCANHSGTFVGKTADAEDRSAETVPSQRSPASATSLGQQSAAGTCPLAYFERQQAGFARCGLHALNNALGGHIMTADDMSTACTEYLAEMHFEGNTYVVHTFFIIVQCVVCISFYFYSVSYVKQINACM